MAESKLILVVVVMVMAVVVQTTVAQTRHVVGDTLGWNVNPEAAYATWASRQNFTVGDSLVFNFTTNMHNVAEVTEGAFAPCTTTTNPIITATTGPATINLTTAGRHYYICTVGLHCQNGQKLSINVSAAASTPPSSSAPPAGGSGTPPSPSDASASLTTVLPITFLAGAYLATLFY